MTFSKKLLPLTVLLSCGLLSFIPATYASPSCSGAIFNKSSEIAIVQFWPQKGNLYTGSPTGGANCNPTNTKAGMMTCIFPAGSTIKFTLTSTNGKIVENVQVSQLGIQKPKSPLTYMQTSDYDCKSHISPIRLNMPTVCSPGAYGLCIGTTYNLQVYICDVADYHNGSCPPGP